MEDAEKPLLMVFPMDLASHYLRCVALCKRLEPSFRVEIADSDTYRQFAMDANLSTFNVARFKRDQIKDSAANFNFSWLNEKDLTDIMESQVNLILEKKPRAVLGDTSFTLRMAAEKSATRFISLINGYMTKFYGLWREVPRSHPGFRYSKKVPRRIFEIIAREMEYRSLRAVHEPFRKIREVERLGQMLYLLDELEGDLNLVCDLPDLFPQRKAPQNYRYIGPLFHSDGRKEPEILEFLGDASPNVLLTMGSTGDWKKLSFLEDGIFGKYRFVMSGIGSGEINPPNSISRPFVDHLSILPKIDLVICHGGNGTIYQALSHGIPVLCVPANFECEWNSNRIQANGLGEVIEDHWPRGEIDSKMDSWIKRRDAPNFRRIRQEIAKYTSSPIDILPLGNEG